MSPLNEIIGGSLILSGAIIFGVCWPLFKGHVKPNALYGIRVKKAFQSERDWFDVNRYGAKQMMWAGGVMMICGVIGLLLPFQGHTMLILLFSFLPLLIVLIPAFRIHRYSEKL